MLSWDDYNEETTTAAPPPPPSAPVREAAPAAPVAVEAPAAPAAAPAAAAPAPAALAEETDIGAPADNLQAAQRALAQLGDGTQGGGESVERVTVGAKRMINYARDHSTADGLDYIAIWNASMLKVEEIQEALAAKSEGRAGDFVPLPPRGRSA